MTAVAAACVLLLVLTTTVHYEALRGLGLALPLLPIRPRAKVVVLIIGAFAAHALEIALFAGAMYFMMHWLRVGGFGNPPTPEFKVLLYFSAETYTSLGYGDVVPHGPLRLLAGAEALTGLLMIGWSTSDMYRAMQRCWDDGFGDSGNRP
jgi:hypothetical protein